MSNPVSSNPPAGPKPDEQSIWEQLKEALRKVRPGEEKNKVPPAMKQEGSPTDAERLATVFDEAKRQFATAMGEAMIFAQNGSGEFTFRLVDQSSNLALAKLLDHVSFGQMKDEPDSRNYSIGLTNRFEQAASILSGMATSLAVEPAASGTALVPKDDSLLSKAKLLAEAEAALAPIGGKSEPVLFNRVAEHVRRCATRIRNTAVYLGAPEARHGVWADLARHSAYFEKDGPALVNLFAKNKWVLLGLASVFVVFYVGYAKQWPLATFDPTYLSISALVTIVILYVLARSTRNIEIRRVRDDLRLDIRSRLSGIAHPKGHGDDLNLLAILDTRWASKDKGYEPLEARGEESALAAQLTRAGRTFASISKWTRWFFDNFLVQYVIGFVVGAVICIVPVVLAAVAVFGSVKTEGPEAIAVNDFIGNLVAQRPATIVAVGETGETCELASGNIIWRDAQQIVVRSGKETIMVPTARAAFIRFDPAGSWPRCDARSAAVSPPPEQTPATVNVPVTVNVPAPAILTGSGGGAQVDAMSYFFVDGRTVEITNPLPDWQHIIIPAFVMEVKDIGDITNAAGYRQNTYTFPVRMEQASVTTMLAPTKEILDAKVRDGCNVEVDVKGYASVKSFPKDSDLHNWILAEGRRAAVLQSLNLIDGDGNPVSPVGASVSGGGKITLVQGEGGTLADVQTKLVPRFASYEEMRDDRLSWLREPEPSPSSAAVITAISKSVVVSIKQADLAGCRRD